METVNYQNFRIDAENICVDYNGKVALYDANLRLKPDLWVSRYERGW